MAEKLRYEISAKDKSAKALRSVKNGLAQTTRAANLLKGALGGLALGLVIKRLGDFTKQSIQTADAIAKTADKVGISVRALQELRFAADLAGVSQSKLDGSIERFTKRIGEASQGTGEALKALDQLGVAFDIGKEIRPTEDILRDVADAMMLIDSPATKAALAAQMFGREGVALTNLLKTGSKGLAAYALQAENAGAILETKLARQAEVLNDEMTVANHTLKVAKTRIGVAFGQAGLVNTFAKSLDKVAKHLSNPRIARGLVRAIETVNKAFILVIRHANDIIVALGIIFGAKMLMKAFKFAIGILKVGKAIATFSVAIGLAKVITNRWTIAIGGVTFLLAELFGITDRVVMDVRTLNGATPSGMTTAAELGDYRNHTVNRCAAELWECHERGLLTREKIKTPTGRACWGYRAPANNGAAA